MDIEVKQFATYKAVMSFTDADGVPVDISAWSFTGSIRETFDSPVITDFNIEVLSLVSASIEVRLDPSQTSMFTGSKYQYDIIAGNVTPNPDEVYRLMEGKVKVRRGVTVAIEP